MKRDAGEIMIFAGMIILLCALLWIPDWRGAYEQYVQILKYEVYGR